LKLISGFPPPMFYSEAAEVGGGHGEGSSGHIEAEYRDLEEAMEVAKEQNLPVLVDFTGWACVNCRKMEETVWPVEKVAEIIQDKVILVSLYVDDRNKLPESEWTTKEYAGKEYRIKTIGNKWSFVQASRFNTNAQPFYVMLDHDGTHIGGTAGYDPDPELFVEFLEDGLSIFEKRHGAKAEK
jgi:thioredoxin-related protein